MKNKELNEGFEEKVSSKKTGKIINGAIHNPHYFDYMNNQDEMVVNNPGTHPCGGVPVFHYYRNIVINKTRDNPNILRDIRIELYHKSIAMFRALSHFSNWEVDRLREDIQNYNNKEHLRFRYLLGEMTEKDFKSKLDKDDMQCQKKTAILQIFELVNTVFLENINNYQNSLAETSKKKYHDIHKLYNVFERNINDVRKYANNELFKVGLNFYQVVPFIQSDFYTYNLKVTKKTNKEIFLNEINKKK